VVFQLVRLIDYQHGPFDAAQRTHHSAASGLVVAGKTRFWGSHHDFQTMPAVLLARSILELVASDELTVIRAAVVHYHVHVRPCFHLTFPVDHNAEWRDNKEWTSHSLSRFEKLQEGGGLDGFSKPHLVGKNRVASLAPIEEHPPHTFPLVVPKLTPQHDRWGVALHIP